MKQRSRLRIILWVGLVTIIGAAAGASMGGWTGPEPQSREITVVAHQYAYDPPRLHVNVGDTITLKLHSLDVIHGFYLEGHDLDAEIRPQEKTFTVTHPSSGKETEEVESYTFKVNRRGKFRYRCSHTCGTMHPFMTGELIVGPNTPLHAGVGGMIGLFIGFMLALRKTGDGAGVADGGDATT